MDPIIREYLEEAPEYGLFDSVEQLVADVHLYVSCVVYPFKVSREAVMRELVRDGAYQLAAELVR
jgi:hypothetical protein